jgi:hypothetical protein
VVGVVAFEVPALVLGLHSVWVPLLLFLLMFFLLVF